MKILWVRTGKLLPLDMGGKIRSYHILRHLARHHELTLLSYYGGARDEAYERESVRDLPGAVALHTAIPESSLLKQGFCYLRNLLTPLPFSVAKFTAPEVQFKVGAWIGERRFDVAVCDFLSASLNFPQSLATPTILFQHNVESVMWQRQARGQRPGLKKILFAIEAAKLSHYERSAVNRFDHVIAVSEQDRELMKSMTQPERISVVPTGVDLERFCSAASQSPTQPIVTFVGHMNYEPNIDAAEFFCREVWPLVRRRMPQARFRIVGRTPHARVRRLESDSVEVVGRVPSVTEFYQEAQVVVVPLRMGGGTRLKIYEAMAAGKPIVSTSLGAEGLDVTDGKNILLADQAGRFAECVGHLLSDRAAGAQIGKAAAALAAEYDWPAVAMRFEQVLGNVLALRRRKGPASPRQDPVYGASELAATREPAHTGTK